MSNLIQRTTEFALHILRAYIAPGDTVIDATCGGGRDSLALAQMLEGSGRLYAFDIQPTAVESTRALLAKAGCDAVTVCLDHRRMGDYFRARGLGEGFASAIVFNLGYLPGSDRSITTRTDSTLEAVSAGLDLLKKDGLLCITMYSGHPGGADEKRALLAFAEGLDPKRWHTAYVSMPNQKACPPEILLISRKL